MALNGIRAAFFDLDGTLIDSAPDITAAFNEALEMENLPAQPQERVLGWIGRGPERLVESALNHTEGSAPAPSRLRRVTAHFQDAYRANICRLTCVFDGARDVLDELDGRGLGLACITNKMQRLTRPLLEQLDLARYFQVTLCADSPGQRKPSPQPLLRAARLLQAPIERCAMVGDSVNDMDAARAAGCAAVAVSWGYGGPALRVQQADAVIHSLSELLSLLP